ncbi:MAG: HD domain-containing protein [Chloroflexi bacterium]|nr:HD domain-containing protein [Chloroflexota bacterium]
MVQAGVYAAICAIQPLYYILLEFTLSEMIIPFLVAMAIATGAIEGSFRLIFKLRKQSTYPHLIALQLSAVFDLRRACDLALQLTSSYLRTEAALLAWVDPAQRLVPLASHGLPETWPGRQHLTTDQGPMRRVLEGHRAILGQLSDHPCWSGLFDGAHTVAYVPLISMERVVAVLCLIGSRRASDLHDRKLLESIGIVIGLSLENMRLNHRQYQSIMQVLCSALDMRDSATQGHSQRVAHLARLVARRMGLPDAHVKKIEQAAALHDIGKIGVPDAILSKPASLTEDEWAEMRRHPGLGFQILADIEGLESVAEIVHSHHERYDGGGYPRQLRGQGIPVGARIFAVVDTYDAITSDRPYRRARSHRQAIDEIVRNSGKQFDPTVVRAFLEVERRGLIRPHDHDGRRQAAAAIPEMATFVPGG